jgi:lipid II:glycine glycyltransferase (peptidoglycan interpeptide bridge formation enzyme)
MARGKYVASMMTLSFKDMLMYNHGCSDERFHNLGGMHLPFWNAILEGKRNGARELDLDRSDLDDPGLITFKVRWGATRSRLTYWRYPSSLAPAAAARWRMWVAMKAFARLPDHFVMTAGKMSYKHVG